MAKQVYDDQKFTGVRLPNIVKPLDYDITLKPDLKNFTFSGKVKIRYTSNEKPCSIVLHANELKISDGSADNDNPLSTVTYSKKSETATLEFKEPLQSNGVLNLDFTGILNDKMKGFYRTAFKLDGETVYAATTQFEATDARMAFPCWDEPNLKAAFTITMICDDSITVNGRRYEQVALSNMPVESKNGNEIRFQKSPIMSTYLLAFIVGPFEMIEAIDSKKRPIRVYTTPGKKDQGQYALDVAVKSLLFYENYFKIDYPLPKMDLVAIPDFTSGAMENWGLVTYRETCLLFDENNTSTDRKRYIAIVVAHELAHQWFGNLVTMEWWTHLWLNEGFASFMEYLCVDHIFPDYDIWSEFVTDAYGIALSSDSLHNSHPIEVPVNHPSEIMEIFDNISYNKGSSIIRMLYEFIGDDSFRQGMNKYLNKFAYKNAITEDLWDALEEASKKPVSKIMSGWTAQKGYPWLSVEYTPEGDNAKLTLKQSQFTADGVLNDDERGVKWMVPLNAITSNNPSRLQTDLLETESKIMTVEGVGQGWLKLNANSTGLYRVAYPESLIDRLRPAISDRTLPPMDRLNVQSDFSALCQAGKVSSIEVLKLLQAYKGETVYTVWKSIDRCVGRFSTLLTETDFVDSYNSFAGKLYSEVLARSGWDSRPDDQSHDLLLRALVINRLVALGDMSVIDEAKKRFRAHVAKSSVIPADLRNACYRAAAAFGDQSDFDSLLEIYKTADLHEEVNRAGRALGFSKDPKRLDEAVKFVMSNQVRNQDKVFIISSIGVSSPSVAWKLLQDGKDYFRETYENTHTITWLVSACTQNFTSLERANEISKFFEENTFSGAERTIQQSLETIRLSADWLKRDGEAIKKFLNAPA